MARDSITGRRLGSVLDIGPTLELRREADVSPAKPASDP
jgi:hypothetical protein